MTSTGIAQAQYILKDKEMILQDNRSRPIYLSGCGYGAPQPALVQQRPQNLTSRLYTPLLTLIQTLAQRFDPLGILACKPAAGIQSGAGGKSLDQFALERAAAARQAVQRHLPEQRPN
jgi:hypothetical protein